MEKIISFIQDHSLISLILLVIAIGGYATMKDDKRDYERAKDWNNNSRKDFKGYVNRENDRRRDKNKEDNILGLLILVAIGFVVYKLFIAQ